MVSKRPLGRSNRFIEAIQMLQRIVLRAFPNTCLSERTSCPFLVLRVFVTLFNLQGAHRQPAGASYYHSSTLIVNTFFRFFQIFQRRLGPVVFSAPRSACKSRLSTSFAVRLRVSDLPILPLRNSNVNTFFSFFPKFFQKTLRVNMDDIGAGLWYTIHYI